MDVLADERSLSGAYFAENLPESPITMILKLGALQIFISHCRANYQIIQLNLQFYSSDHRSTSNLMPLFQLLQRFKHRALGPQEAQELLQAMHMHKMDKVPLWRISSIAKLATGTARLQAYLIIYVGLLFVPPAVYQKYQQNPQKIYRLAVYCPIALAVILTPLFFYRRTSKRMLLAIDYHLPTNTLELQTYKKEILKVPLNSIKVQNNPIKTKIVHAIEVGGDKPRLFKVEGYGQWQSLEVFRYLEEKGSLKADQLL